MIHIKGEWTWYGIPALDLQNSDSLAGSEAGGCWIIGGAYFGIMNHGEATEGKEYN